MLFFASRRSGVRVRVRVQDNRLISHSRSCQLPHCARIGRGESGPWCCPEDRWLPAITRFNVRLFGEEPGGETEQPCVSTSDIQPGKPLLSKHCH